MSYTADIAGAYADIAEAGATVTFSRAASAALYDPLRGGFAPTADTASSVAISRPPRGSDAERFAGLDLVSQKVRVLVIAAQGLSFPPAPGHRCDFGGLTYTVRDVAPLDITGADPILYFAAVSV